MEAGIEERIEERMDERSRRCFKKETRVHRIG